MSYKDHCRTCLGNDKEMRQVQSVLSIAGDCVRLSDILQTIYNYTIPPDDSLPDRLCINCVHQLTISYSFKLLIEASAKTLAENIHFVDSTSDKFDANFESEDLKPLKIFQKNQRKKIVKVQTEPKLIEYKSIFCVECKAEFHSVKSLYDHCVTDHTIKSAVGRDCDYCNEKFEDFRSLVLHRRLHVKPFICENCWEGFYNSDDLKRHSCRPNSDNKDRCKYERVMRQCDQCGKSYPPGYIRIHMLTHSNVRAYSCKFCPKKFKVPGSLNSHVLWNHKRTRNHKCEVCNATFISSSSRSSHIRKHHLKEKKYGCESCEKRFFSKSELQRHSLTHTGVKNFHCHLCDKSYQTKHGLNVHSKSHSNVTMNMLDL